MADETALEYLSPGEQEAAIWLRENSETSDVVATNSQCAPPTDKRPACNAIGFWIGGLTGRRMVLEGWGYTAPAHAAHGVDGKHRNRQPPPWPERYDLSHAAIEDPSAAVFEELTDRYDTRWLFAVRRAGELSPDIERFAQPVFDNGEVSIFRLDGD